MQPSKPIRLFWGENYSPKPKLVQQAIEQALTESTSKINLYPGSLYQDVINLISNQLSVPQEQIMLGYGIEGLIHLTSMAFLGKNKKGGMFKPSFFVYENNLHRYKSFEYPCRYDKRVDVKDFIKKVNDVDVFFLASPNTATGNYLLTKDEIELVLKNYHGLFAVDECYYGIGSQTVIDLIPKYKNLIVYRGVTKIMGMGGLRLGFVLGNKTTIDKLKYHFTDIELDPISTLSLNVFKKTFPYFNILAKNTNQFFKDFLNFIRKSFPQDKFIKTFTTFYFMDIRPYKTSRIEIINFMNKNGYLFSSSHLTDCSKDDYPEFIELTPPPQKYWNNFALTLKKALNQK